MSTRLPATLKTVESACTCSRSYSSTGHSENRPKRSLRSFSSFARNNPYGREILEQSREDRRMLELVSSEGSEWLRPVRAEASAPGRVHPEARQDSRWQGAESRLPESTVCAVESSRSIDAPGAPTEDTRHVRAALGSSYSLCTRSSIGWKQLVTVWIEGREKTL